MNDVECSPPATLPRGERLQALIPARRIHARVAELAAAIDALYAGKTVSMIAVLKGSYIFAADLTRRMKVPTTIDFVGASSYGAGMRSSGNVVLNGFDRLDLGGRHVLVIEDILDTGLTIAVILERLRQMAPASLALCALLRKPAAQGLDLPVAHVGFDIPDEFVVGYGLDYAERYRNLRGVYRLTLGSSSG
jgi:hypoxanthine phosphoribosyltransferase